MYRILLDRTFGEGAVECAYTAQTMGIAKIPSFFCAVLAGALFGMLVYLILVKRLKDN
ncbi:MAG: hypothetical protein ACNYPI_06605 [Arenicellales bacterium WSBS_2016_MAG_OTU3]